jgi:hypothetical protein
MLNKVRTQQLLLMQSVLCTPELQPKQQLSPSSGKGRGQLLQGRVAEAGVLVTGTRCRCVCGWYHPVGNFNTARGLYATQWHCTTQRGI